MPTIRQQASSNAGNVGLTGVTAGSTLVGMFSRSAAASPTISGVTGGGAWAQVPGVYYADAGRQYTGDIWIAQNSASGSVTVAPTWSAGSQDHDYILELSPSVLDTAATGSSLASTNTSITIPNAVASSLLVLDAISDLTWGTFSATFTQGTGGPLNGNPFGYVNNPGDTSGRAATFSGNDGGINFGASFKDLISVPAYDVDRPWLEEVLGSGGMTDSELLRAEAWF